MRYDRRQGPGGHEDRRHACRTAERHLVAMLVRHPGDPGPALHVDHEHSLAGTPAGRGVGHVDLDARPRFESGPAPRTGRWRTDRPARSRRRTSDRPGARPCSSRSRMPRWRCQRGAAEFDRCRAHAQLAVRTKRLDGGRQGDPKFLGDLVIARHFDHADHRSGLRRHEVNRDSADLPGVDRERLPFLDRENRLSPSVGGRGDYQPTSPPQRPSSCSTAGMRSIPYCLRPASPAPIGGSVRARCC